VAVHYEACAISER